MSKRYKYIQVSLASPESIRAMSYGEVKNGETINYRTSKPEKDGLFCERIFGPTKDYQCDCSKTKRQTDIGQKCEKCGIEITESKVRRERMGHIELACPVVHEWYTKSGKLATILELKKDDLKRIIYFTAYIVTDPGKDIGLYKGQILTEQDYAKMNLVYRNKFKALSGAEAVEYLLKRIDLDEEAKKIINEIDIAPKQRRINLIKRLEIIDQFRNSGNKLEWMILHVLPVLPPDLRPLVQLDGGRFATTDINKLYKRIIDRNKRLQKLKAQNAPQIIIKNEKRMIQESVDALIDNSKKKSRRVMERNRPLKSLSELLKGKGGRFRQNLLGKRVDYSGRSVIAVGPSLEMHQCGLPKKMALKLFRPFIIKELVDRFGDSISTNKAKNMIDRESKEALSALNKVIKEHPVLLNRAPTLHRLGIQAFEPILVEGKAIRLHPLACPAFNADFDGDQMAVHLPLSEEAQSEARLLMLASNNILNLKDGKPIVTPSQDMVLGNYYLTIEENQRQAGNEGEARVYLNKDEAEISYENKEIGLHTRILVPAKSLSDFYFTKEQQDAYLITTYGKLIFNTIMPTNILVNKEDYIEDASDPQALVYDKHLVEIPGNDKKAIYKFCYLNDPTNDNLIDHTDDGCFVFKHATDKPCCLANGDNPKDYIAKEALKKPFKKGYLSDIIAHVLKIAKTTETSKMLDKIKDLGFKYSTVAGITVASSDVTVLDSKKEILQKAQERVDEYQTFYDRGLLTDDKRSKLVVETWTKAKDTLEAEIKVAMAKGATTNHIYMMADSGARGNASNFTQLSGMRGLMASPNGGTMELPVKSAFIEGVKMSEFFISTHGARKGSTDTALKTAESGYLTRRLVDVSQEVVVNEIDCGTDRGTVVRAIYEKPHKGGSLIEPLFDRIAGRYTSKSVYNPETGELIIGKNKYITDEIAQKIVDLGIEEVEIRTVLKCNSRHGVCIHCYGRNLATGEKVEVGEAVGVIAAQSIGEPGTQLTMRTFHTGGVAGSDITQGLPRVEQLFEARRPKNPAAIASCNGVIKSITPNEDSNYIEFVIEHDYLKDKDIVIKSESLNQTPIVKVGDHVNAGDKLVEGSIYPVDLLRVSDVEKTQNYLIDEVQKIYRSQGVEIQDKHIEVIVNQMFKNVTIVEGGETKLLPGTEVSVNRYYRTNKEAIAAGKRPAIARAEILSITKSAVRSESWLSAASFQQTTKVLTDAVFKGQKDYLVGLKENVIIGGLIPAGTGILDNINIDYDEPEEEIDDTLDDDVIY